MRAEASYLCTAPHEKYLYSALRCMLCLNNAQHAHVHAHVHVHVHDMYIYLLSYL